MSVPSGAIQREDLVELSAGVRGEVVTRGSREYDSARSIWNAMIDRTPLAVVRCGEAEDVVSAIGFARDRDLPLAVRGGGHSVAGNSTCDDGIVIDLGPMRNVTVDPGRRRVKVAGGSLLADVDRAGHPHGLVTPAGLVSHTGVGGLALGGGVGWLTRKFGLTCDNLEAATVVLADGRIVNTDESQLPDLFWALRGGGGNFGVVTDFEFRCHPLPSHLPVGVASWRLDDARPFLQAYRESMPDQPDEVKGTIVASRAPDAPWVPVELIGEPICTLYLVYAGDDMSAAERAFRDLGASEKPALSTVTRMDWLDIQTMDDAVSGHGKCNYTKGGYLNNLPDGAIDALIDHGHRLPSESIIEVIPHGGAQLRLGDDDTAFGHRDAMYSFNVYSRWSPEDTPWQPKIDWARMAYSALAQFATGGVYTNFFSEDDRLDRVKAAYGPNKYRRLSELKTRFDPTNLFSLNGNIEPAPESDSRAPEQPDDPK